MDITVDGVRYVEVKGITLDRNSWMLRWAKTAGLLALVDQPAPTSQDAARRQLERIIEDAMSSDSVAPLLAGTLAPEGVKWTRAVASESIDAFGAAEGAEAAALLDVFGVLVVGFLKRAPDFWKNIGHSSSETGKQDASRDSAPAPTSPIPTPGDLTTSPGGSPATTPSDST